MSEQAPKCFNPVTEFIPGTLFAFPRGDTMKGEYHPGKVVSFCPQVHKPPEFGEARCGLRWVKDNMFKGNCPALGGAIVLFANKEIMKRLLEEAKSYGRDTLTFS